MKTVIISNLYIGSSRTNYAVLKDFLSNLRCDRLILNGDIFEYWCSSPKKIREEQKEIIYELHKVLSRINTYLILGDHDLKNNKDPMIPGLQGREIYTFIDNNRKIIILHGHQFDSWFRKLVDKPLFWVGLFLYKLFGRIPICSRSDIRHQQRLASEKYRENYDVVVTGHAYRPGHCLENPKIEYVNSSGRIYVIIMDGRVMFELYRG